MYTFCCSLREKTLSDVLVAGASLDLEVPNIRCTPFAVQYEKRRNRWRETVTNSLNIHSLAREYEHMRINQIQLRFLNFNLHSITLLGIHMRHWAFKIEKYTFINANIKVINTILKVNRDN